MNILICEQVEERVKIEVVYETFENEGVKDWPRGYNPKPLIAKSIRNLALEYTQQRLVSLRRI